MPDPIVPEERPDEFLCQLRNRVRSYELELTKAQIQLDEARSMLWAYESYLLRQDKRKAEQAKAVQEKVGGDNG